ncbi:hypothetical protein ED208_07245 [Stagnimonas aquatica]|uniref:Uncharacterized protein n=1 Tax=Stagnimonas aquatica TaxID=2689987 RepID=A0A3N0VHH5_9GAMM|nr:hypothetical protein [Stagnimonas aquatica]ROH92154.1 hypothetical protein ED208_07245 [Stagnimonas aquatica]
MRSWLPTLLLSLVCALGLFGARAIAQAAAEADAAPAAAVPTEPDTELTQVSAETAASESAPVAAAQDDFDFFSDAPVQSAEVVELPPEKSRWLSLGGPLALFAFFFLVLAIIWWLVPFSSHSVDINLRDFPPAAKRGIALAVAMFGIAFCFGASEIWYQLRLHGSAEAYFAQMSLGKLIAFTHAHLFGFTTSFFIIGIPFSMQFNQLQVYQWVFPAGLAASLTDVMSWWGIKFLSPNFEWVSMFCGIVFSVSYLWMLIGLLRVLLFPEVIWASDKDRAPRLAAKAEQRQAARHGEGDY